MFLFLIIILMETRRLQRGLVPFVGDDGYLLHMADGTSFFLFSIATLMFDLNSGRYENTKKRHVQSSKIFIPKKDFRVVYPERLH